MKKIITLLLCLVSMAATAQSYKPVLITPPANMKTVEAMATVTTVDYDGSTGTDMLNIVLGTADGKVYLQGLDLDCPEAWIRGEANAAKDAITFAHGQYIGLFFSILDLYACGCKVEDNAKRVDLVLDRNPKTGVLTLHQGINYCSYYYDDMSSSANKYYPVQRYSSVTITPFGPWEPDAPNGQPDETETKEPVVVPDGVEFVDYTLYGTSIRTGHLSHPAKLAFDPSTGSGEAASGQTVYMRDFCSVSLQTGCSVKGHFDGHRLVFPKEQFMVRYGGQFDMYLYGASYYLGDNDIYLDDLSFVYDPSTDTFTCENGVLIAQGKFTDQSGDFSEYLQNVTLVGRNPNGVTSVAAPSVALPDYLIDGRRATSAAKGIVLRRTSSGEVRKVVR